MIQVLQIEESKLNFMINHNFNKDNKIVKYLILHNKINKLEEIKNLKLY